MIASPRQADEIAAELLMFFAPESIGVIDRLSIDERRTALASVLTARAPEPIPEDRVRLLDSLLQWELSQRTVVRARDLPRVAADGPASAISLWQGDITTLEIDAIVNAANDRMLGCFIPGHACIDNAIHAAAGPELRAECARHMSQQGHPEPTGSATITGGYHLPSRYVVHTVGPIVPSHTPTNRDAALLASSYRCCLDASASNGNIHSIAFCSISTGVFGYPIAAATEVAVRTVLDWITAHPEREMHVVFNTFSERDTMVYERVLAEETS